MCVWQVYKEALQLAFKRYNQEGSSQAAAEEALVPFQELCQRVAAAHAGFVSNAGESVASIVHDSIDFVFQACPHRDLCTRGAAGSLLQCQNQHQEKQDAVNGKQRL